MDNKKAFNTLIVIFVIINIIMTTYIIYISTRNRNFNEEIEYVNEIMNYRGITVDCRIPSHNETIETLEYEKAYFTEEMAAQIKNKTEGTVLLNKDKSLLMFTGNKNAMKYEDLDRYKVDSIVKEFLSQIGFYNEMDYVIDSNVPASSKSYRIKYIYYKDRKYYYDLYINAIVSIYGIERIEIKAINYDTITNVSEQTAIPVTNILMSKVVKKENYNTVIEKIDRGFKENKEGEALSAWRIYFSDGTIRYYNMQNGEEIS